MNQPSDDMLSCGVCCNYYLGQEANSGSQDRRPAIVCENGHSLCMFCITIIKDELDATCPSCRGKLLEKPIINVTVLQAVDLLLHRLSKVPEIDAAELTLDPEPFADGAFADVYHAKWKTQDVVVKTIRQMSELEHHKKLMMLEAHLAIGLHHPNIIQLFGVTTVQKRRFAIVMEKAEFGSLERHMTSMETKLAVRVCLGVVDGLEYVHSKKVAHRDLKPGNILFCSHDMIPKISDFGVAKVMQTLVTNSAMAGTPKYAAPELLEPGSECGYTVDIFSLTVIMYELFSHRKAEEGLGANVMQIMFAVVKGRRPKIPDDFSSHLISIVSRGWAGKASDRPPLSEFRSALQSMNDGGKIKPVPASEGSANESISMSQQSKEVAKRSLPLPMISLEWDTSCEILNSQELRKQMVQNMSKKSNMSKIINLSVLISFEAVPRHLFIHVNRLSSFITTSQPPSDEDVIAQSYAYNKAMPATKTSNEASPEIIGTQLSLTEIIQGQFVLLVGVNGGYIQSLVAQLVGRHGRVVTVTSDGVALALCRDRVNANCPLNDIVTWLQVSDVTKPSSIIEAVRKKNLLFHTVIYCGLVDTFPSELNQLCKLTESSSIMAPVKGKDGNVRFQLSVRREGVTTMKTITDFGVRFAAVL